MRLGLIALLCAGLALLGYAGLQASALLGKADVPAPAATPETRVTADWRYDAIGGFDGEVTFGPAAASDAASPLLSVLPIRYPQDFEGGLSLHRLDQTKPPEALYQSRQASGLEYLSCLAMDSGLSLSADARLQTVLRDLRVCRVRTVGAGPPIKAVIGYVSPSRNMQPIDKASTRCAGEVSVWMQHVAGPDTRFAVCMIVLDEAQGRADLVVFERAGDTLVVRASQTGTPGEGFFLSTARASENLERYRLFQSWMNDSESVDPAVYGALEDVARFMRQRGEPVNLKAYFRVEEISVYDRFIRVHLRSRSDARLKAHNRLNQHLRTAVWDLICSDPKGAALLDAHQLDTLIEVRLRREDGRMWMDGRHDAAPCVSWRE